MSNIVRAKVIKTFFVDVECVEEALLKNPVPLGLELKKTTDGFIMDYTLSDPLHEKFVKDFPLFYDSILKEKIERLHREEASALADISEEERRTREIKLRRERMRLEGIQKKEAEENRLRIGTEIKKIIGKARASGFEIKEERQGKEVVYQFIRRG
jgi:hypothetical protein